MSPRHEADIASTALPALTTSPTAALTLLNNLGAAGYLSGGLSNVQGGRWRLALLNSIASLLSSLAAQHGSVDHRKQLVQALKLLPSLQDYQHFLAPLETLLQGVTRSSKGGNREQFVARWEDEGIWNDAHLCAATLKCIGELAPIHAEVDSLTKTYLLEKGVMQALVNGFDWNRELLEVLANLGDQWSSDHR